MVRLISFLVLFAIFLAFIGLNLNNNCNVNFGFHTFNETPIYITVMVSFFLGMLCTIPILATFRTRKHDKPKKEKPEKKNKSALGSQDEIPKESGSYGID